MHIPDGFINGATSLGAGVVAAGGVGISLRASAQRLQERHVPLAGLLAAFIFVLQMLNFPVAAGTSGHLLGGALAAVLVGPWMGMAVVSVVVFVQALLFADGGVSALGLNVLNMAVVTTLVGWVAFRAVMAILPKHRSAVGAAVFVAGLISVVASSTGFVIEYALGGVGGASIRTVFAAMTGVHFLIGIGEGLISAAVVASVLAVRPDLVHGAARYTLRDGGPRASKAGVGGLVAAGLAIALGLGWFVAPSADSNPDGLERVAIDQGIGVDTDHALDDSPLADYSVQGVDDGGISTGLAAAAGIGATFLVGAGIVAGFRIAQRRRTPEPA